MKEEKATRKRFHKPYHFLSKVGKQDISCLSEIFKNFPPGDFRQELNLWQHIALSNDQSAYDDGGGREDLMDFIQGLHKLMEAFYLIHQKRNAAGKGSSKPGKQAPGDIHSSIVLTEEEKRDPYTAIYDFCKTFPAGYAKTEIPDLLDAVVTYDGNKPVHKGSLVLFYQHLHCLVRLAYRMRKNERLKKH